MNDLIDITVTATNRPKVFLRTLKSLRRNVIDTTGDFRLIINIDNIGDKKSPQKVLNIAKSYFQYCKFNISNEPSFPKAIIWCWSQVKSDVFIHIEDDWLFLRKMNVYELINKMRNDKKLASIKFSKYRRVRGNDNFEKEDKFGTSPGLIKKSFIEKILPYLSNKPNPEKQFNDKNKKLWSICKKWNYERYYFYGNRVIKDIGRKWLERKGFCKIHLDKSNCSESSFTSWEKKHG